MREFYPLLFAGGAAGFFSLIFLVAYLTVRRKKEAVGFDRNMKDSEIIRRLLRYAREHFVPAAVPVRLEENRRAG